MPKVSAPKIVGLLVGLAIAIPLVLLMFIAPAAMGNPHDLPIGVAGPEAATTAAAQALQTQQPGAFAVTTYPDVAALKEATENRTVYGGFVLGAEPVTVIATGGSPAVAAQLTQMGSKLSEGSASVIDVAKPASGDPRGSGFGSMVMPVFMAGAALGIALSQLARRATRIAILLPIGAFLVGATTVAMATWVGVLDGFWLPWLALSTGILAISATVAGLVSFLGLGGMGVAVVLFMLVGMPLSGIGSPPEFLPAIWATVGQWLPLGATGTALRSATFFDGAGSAGSYVVLAVWIAIGYLLLAASVAKARRLARSIVVSDAADTASA